MGSIDLFCMKSPEGEAENIAQESRGYSDKPSSPTKEAWTQFPSNAAAWLEEIERRVTSAVGILSRVNFHTLAEQYPAESTDRQRLESLAESAHQALRNFIADKKRVRTVPFDFPGWPGHDDPCLKDDTYMKNLKRKTKRGLVFAAAQHPVGSEARQELEFAAEFAPDW
jgi:hypothetical protein